MVTPPDTSNWARATVDPQLVAVVRELMIRYELLHGSPAPLLWLLRELQLEN